MDFTTSPPSSTSSTPTTSIGWPSPTSSLSSSPRSISSSQPHNLICAFPSWPTGPSLHRTPFTSSAPSAFISDADLFPDELLDESFAGPLLREAPAPPRAIPLAALPLAPLYAQAKPKKQRPAGQAQEPKQRRGSRKARRTSKPMTPISESPEAPSE
ncbi:hypothetical protein EJ06DRAFT_537535 [Trichodelitschia bisporula]|uniref:Uncharacterized protein n=1 Tax=Trichodelitschia bisporula TaxID=703511 RepID=A0A6G1HZR6_9PEZI|nr:hypothetical protein EJ06DRAFT_537535 [Trichodelitschia bisporula]